ncbi:MAG: class I SAM-dependent methyltransferase [Actinomycetota bacterium]|nr:class I SAM-dependent methyltransferase [Actinomycetota bacterium]
MPPEHHVEPLKWFPEHERSEWFHERYEDAANEVIEYFGRDFISLTGADVADIGCGDGFIDLGVAHKALPARLVGFDTRPTDVEQLARIAAEEGVAGPSPVLSFKTSEPNRLPSPAAAFDAVFSWSVLDHVGDPVAIIREIHRVLRPGGHLMIQLYPFFYSQHGSHLEQWFPEGFAQFRYSDEDLEQRVRADPGPDPGWAEQMLWTYRNLNKLTLDQLQEALAEAGFEVLRLALITADTHLAPEVAHMPLSLIGIEGVKLLARA